MLWGPVRDQDAVDHVLLLPGDRPADDSAVPDGAGLLEIDPDGFCIEACRSAVSEELVDELLTFGLRPENSGRGQRRDSQGYGLRISAMLVSLTLAMPRSA